MYTPIPNDSRAYGNNRWYGRSPKLGRNVWMYSDLEYDHWILVEMDRDVVEFCEQPLRVRTEDGETIFDMWLRKRNGVEEFREVKFSWQINPSHAKADLRSIEQVRIQEEWCRTHGYAYSVQTEREIRQNPVFLQNMKTLFPYLRLHSAPVETDVARLIHHISKDRISLPQLYGVLHDMSRTRVMEALTWLYLEGKIDANFATEPIGAATEVWINEEAATN
jgi:hypothetical protein